MHPVIDVRRNVPLVGALAHRQAPQDAEAYVDRASDNSYFPVVFLVTFFGALAYIFFRFG